MPMTIIMLAGTALLFQTALLLTAQHSQRMDDLIRREQSRFLAASCWNMAVEQLQQPEPALEKQFRFEVEQLGTCSGSWSNDGSQEIILTCTGQVEKTQYIYSGRLRREPVGEQLPSEPDNAPGDEKIEPEADIDQDSEQQEAAQPAQPNIKDQFQLVVLERYNH